MLSEVAFETTAGSLPLLRLALSRKAVIISSHGIASGSEHHEPKTEAAWTDSSQREWRIFETVSPLCEKAHSTSVDVATK
jgi:hypothetical protein